MYLLHTGNGTVLKNIKRAKICGRMYASIDTICLIVRGYNCHIMEDRQRESTSLPEEYSTASQY